MPSAAGEAYQTLPFVRPGGQSLLRMDGWPKVERVLQTIDAVEALGIDPADAAPDYWQHVHNRLSVNETPAPTRDTRHQAWLKRREIGVMTRLATIARNGACQRPLGTSAFVDLPKTADLECQRQRTDRPLFPAAGREYRRYRSRRDRAAAADRAIPGRSRLSADRRAADETHPGAAGATVCRQGLDILVYDATVGRARERDSAGRKLPVWQGCRTIGDGELFLMNWDVPDSVDGRYFGPFPRGSVIGRALPVLTDEAGDGRFEWWAATR